MESTLITLTSDLGSRDPYLASVKGRLLSNCPGVQLLDVSHELKPWDLNEAAWTLAYAWPNFPAETIHWIGLDYPAGRKVGRDLICFHEGHYFIGQDNGMFALLFEKHPDFIFEIRSDLAEEMGMQGIYSNTICAAIHLWKGREILDIASEVSEIYTRTLLRPVIQENAIRASVIHIDRFGNALLNITMETLEEVADGRDIYLRYRARERIDGIKENYHDVEAGERLCRVNESGYLEIAINQGHAASLLGLDLNQIVQIAFQTRADDNANRENGISAGQR